MEQQNIEITTKKCTGHAECTLADRASQERSKDFLWKCTLYSPQSPAQCVQVFMGKHRLHCIWHDRAPPVGADRQQ
ncbi:MAG: hypothetical protein ACLUB2_00420 [Butyricicoccus pullicaecorum]